MIQRTEEESEYGEHYRISLDEMLILYDTLVLGLELPPTVVAAINRKVEQYYLVQEYALPRRPREEGVRAQADRGQRHPRLPADRHQGISDSYVRWRGIEATLQLAQSPNTKIVIIGSGKDGLPVILGNVDTPIAPAAKPDGAAPAPDNSEAPAPKERTTGQAPPPLEKTPATNLPQPSERPPPQVPMPIAPPGAAAAAASSDQSGGNACAPAKHRRRSRSRARPRSGPISGRSFRGSALGAERGAPHTARRATNGTAAGPPAADLPCRQARIQAPAKVGSASLASPRNSTRASASGPIQSRQWTTCDCRRALLPIKHRLNDVSGATSARRGSKRHIRASVRLKGACGRRKLLSACGLGAKLSRRANGDAKLVTLAVKALRAVIGYVAFCVGRWGGECRVGGAWRLRTASFVVVTIAGVAVAVCGRLRADARGGARLTPTQQSAAQRAARAGSRHR